MYKDGVIADLLHATDIVQVISSYIPVTKKGRNYVAMCPFHDDHNPSMNINVERQIFKCFVCGEGGDAIKFVQEYEHISWKEAVRKVAELVGFHDPRLQSYEKTVSVDPVKEPLYKAMADLAAYYRYYLDTPEAKPARDYLALRHIDQDQVNRFGIGYAPVNGQATVQWLQGKGHSLKTIQDIGIASSNDNGPMSDMNAGRLIFPICSPSGQVIAFSARVLLNTAHVERKYVNTVETKIWTKGDNLWNYHLAATEARHVGYVYVQEGFMDVMALDKAGVKAAVALMGTALTSEQIELLRKLHAEVRFCLDGDAAGQKGMAKGIQELQRARIPVRVVSNPGDLRDPDDILQQEGPTKLLEEMNHLVDPTSFMLEYYTSTKKLETAKERKAVLDHFLPYAANLPPGIEQENFLVKLAKVTGYEADAVRRMLPSTAPQEEAAPTIEFAENRPKRSDDVPRSRLDKAERTILYYILRSDEAIQYFDQTIGSFQNDVYNDLANYIMESPKDGQGKVEIAQVLGCIQEDQCNDPSRSETLTSTLMQVDGEENHLPCSDTSLSQCGKAIAEEKAKLMVKTSTEQELASGDKTQQVEALMKFRALRQQRFEESKKKKN